MSCAECFSFLKPKAPCKRGYWVVWVQGVKDAEAMKPLLAKWQEMVSSGAVKLHFMGKPSAVFEVGKEMGTVIAEFPSLDEAIKARNEGFYPEEVLKAAGKPIEDVAVRDFRIIEADEGLIEKGKGYWVAAVQEMKDAEAMKPLLAKWKEYVDSGAFKLKFMGKPSAVFESGKEMGTVIAEFPTVADAIKARTEGFYPDEVLKAAGKPIEDVAVRDFRVIGA